MVLGDHQNEDTGWTLNVSRSHVQKWVGGGRFDWVNAEAIARIQEILREAVRLTTEADRANATRTCPGSTASWRRRGWATGTMPSGSRSRSGPPGSVSRVHTVRTLETEPADTATHMPRGAADTPRPEGSDRVLRDVVEARGNAEVGRRGEEPVRLHDVPAEAVPEPTSAPEGAPPPNQGHVTPARPDGAPRDPLPRGGAGGVKGSVTFTEGERPVVRLVRGWADVSTLLERVGAPSPTRTTPSWSGTAGPWLDALGGGFARGFERYLRDGQAPVPELRGVFERFRGWLSDIYARLKGSPVEADVHPEVRALFDRMLGGEGGGPDPPPVEADGPEPRGMAPGPPGRAQRPWPSPGGPGGSDTLPTRRTSASSDLGGGPSPAPAVEAPG